MGSVGCSATATNISIGNFTKIIPIRERNAHLPSDTRERLPRALVAYPYGGSSFRNGTLGGPIDARFRRWRWECRTTEPTPGGVRFPGRNPSGSKASANAKQALKYAAPIPDSRKRLNQRIKPAIVHVMNLR
jgi:hypothetical protein